MIVALTGGIGSGKSEAAKQFATLGVPIVDVDIISHELTSKQSPLLQEIRHVFGEHFIHADGSLNRPKLRELVFKEHRERLKLENMLHPAIHTRALEQISENEIKIQPAYQLLVIPLLFESSRYHSIISKTLVIDCDESLQIKRAMARSHMSELEIKAIMNTQVARSARLALADAVILNDGTLTNLQEKVAKTHDNFIKTCINSK